MRKFAKIILFINGIYFILNFFISIAYSYYLMRARMFAAPPGIPFTIVLSGILFFLPGIACLTVSYILKRKETK